MAMPIPTGNILQAFLRRRLVVTIDQVPFVCRNLSMARTWNWFRTESAARLRPETTWGLPTVIQVEPSSRCNLKCALCPVTEGLQRPQTNLDPGLFEKVMAEIGDTLLVALFWDWGEPLLNPGLGRIIAAAKSRGIATICSSNGHALAQGDVVFARQAIQQGLALSADLRG
jgi:hypothetical protein